jgi:hypothetical protein
MADPEAERHLERHGLETEKLRLEVAALKRQSSQGRSLSSYVPLISVLVAVAGLALVFISTGRNKFRIENRRNDWPVKKMRLANDKLTETGKTHKESL